MAFVNIMEKVVQEALQEYVAGNELRCECEKCRADILVLTLNRIPPKYVSTPAGEMYVKALYLNPQNKMDVMREITRSVLIVGENPRH